MNAEFTKVGISLRRVYLTSKDGSCCCFVENGESEYDFDITPIMGFISRALEQKSPDGRIQLETSAWHTAIDLIQCDEFPCPAFLVIEFEYQCESLCIDIPFNRKAYSALIRKDDEG